ncbi:MAG: heme-binding domain-containing protein [Saprospiraceae bacterium]|nr:heme-binding domain-containing protein [Saprospiraceae bacterium]
MKRNIKRVLIFLLVILVGIQFIRIDKTNPPSDPTLDFIAMENPPEDLVQIFKVACYDCHSHHTVYPWYTNIAPISFWIKGHINHARSHLDFSEWASYDRDRKHHKLEECYEEVEEGHMPLPSYLWIHRDATLSSGQRQDLVSWFKGQMSKYE